MEKGMSYEEAFKPFSIFKDEYGAVFFNIFCKNLIKLFFFNVFWQGTVHEFWNAVSYASAFTADSF